MKHSHMIPRDRKDDVLDTIQDALVSTPGTGAWFLLGTRLISNYNCPCSANEYTWEPATTK